MAKQNKPQEVKITPQGSLGILALGAVGLRKWREVRDEYMLQQKDIKKNGKESR